MTFTINKNEFKILEIKDYLFKGHKYYALFMHTQNHWLIMKHTYSKLECYKYAKELAFKNIKC